MNVVVGQRVTGKFTASRGKGRRPEIIYPQGTVTKVTEKEFHVDFPEIRGGWKYRESDIDRIVYLREPPVSKIEENLDYELEKERLGIED